MHLVGISEIADLTGVSKQVVGNWRSRNSDFPEPAAELKSGPVWNFDDVAEWLTRHGMAMKDAQAPPSVKKGRKMAVTVGVVNMKGGVGKSTLTSNLGWYCAYNKNLKVLLVDLDPQFNLSQYVMGSDAYEELHSENKATVLDVFEQHTPPAITGVPRKQLLPKDVIVEVREWPDGSK